MPGYTGGCHCGNISVVFETELTPDEITPRNCQCSFCRKHATRALSDPAGHIRIKVAKESGLSRYQFGTKATEFLLCNSCGVYVSAYMPDGESAFANVLANCLDDPTAFRPGEASDYSGEDEAGKRQRRREKWTPATLTVED